MPRISVIIPAYNCDRTIAQTVNSVLTQTFGDLELIVIDDGSQDKTLEILSNISDPRVQVFSYPNAGVSATRNRGIAKATGDFIAFLDSDDLWTPDKLETQLEALQNDPDAAVAYSWTDYIDENGQFLRSGTHVTATGWVYDKLLVQNFLENGSSALIRQDALDRVGGFDESLFGPEDWDLYLRLAANDRFVAIPRVQILYRISTQSVSTNLQRQERQCLQVIDRGFKNASADLQSRKRASLANLYQYLAFKALEGTPSRSQSLAGLRYLWLAVQNDAALLKRSRLMSIVALKLATGILLPPSLAQTTLKSIKKLYQK